MTLVISKGITLRKGWQPMDSDAAAYITAVETADTEPLEERTKIAIDNFVLGCKNDGIWPAIKASCILAGARTLTGALVPLVGTAPTNFNFVSDDYDRKTGLVGDESTKYLDSNRDNDADPQNDKHLSVYATQLQADQSNPPFIASGGGNRSIINADNFGGAVRLLTTLNNGTATKTVDVNLVAPVFIGVSRSSSADYTLRRDKANVTISQASNTPASNTTTLYRRIGGIPTEYASHRLAFYSIGESLNLALLDARVTTLINAFAAAIP
jgi:hypothetical protein